MRALSLAAIPATTLLLRASGTANPTTIALAFLLWGENAPGGGARFSIVVPGRARAVSRDARA